MVLVVFIGSLLLSPSVERETQSNVTILSRFVSFIVVQQVAIRLFVVTERFLTLRFVF